MWLSQLIKDLGKLTELTVQRTKKL